MQSPVRIRDYAPSDYRAVRSLLEEGGLFERDWDREESLREKVDRYPGSIVVAEQGNDVVGVVYLSEDGWGAFLFRLAVRRSHRKMRIGAQLLREAEARLKKVGVRVVSIFVDEADQELREYYEKRGFVPAKLYRCMDKVL